MKIKRNLCRILVAAQLIGISVASALTKDDSPIIAVTPGCLNFAPVVVGTKADFVLTVQNMGGTKLISECSPKRCV
jgi:hypothetical protein